MSSKPYAAILSAEAGARRVVLGSAALLAVLGLAAIVLTPAPAAWRAASACLWLGCSGWRIAATRRTQRVVRRLCVDPGGHVRVLLRDGRTLEGTLAPGTVILSPAAWLAVSAGGRRFSELFTKKRQQINDWRRLHVIRRHVGAVL